MSSIQATSTKDVQTNEVVYPIVSTDNSTPGVSITTYKNEDGSSKVVTDSGDDDVLVETFNKKGKLQESTQYPVETTSGNTTSISYYDGRKESTSIKDGIVTYTSTAADGTETVSSVNEKRGESAEVQAFATSTNALILKAIEDANKSFTRLIEGSSQQQNPLQNPLRDERFDKARMFLKNDLKISSKNGESVVNGDASSVSEKSNSSEFNTHEMMRLVQEILKDLAQTLKDNKEYNIEAAKNQQQNDIKEHLDNIENFIKKMEKAEKKKDFFGGLMCAIAVVGAVLAIAAAVVCPNPLTIAGAVVATAICIDACVAQASGKESLMDRAQNGLTDAMVDAGMDPVAAQILATVTMAVCVIAATILTAGAGMAAQAACKAVVSAITPMVAQQIAQETAKEATEVVIKEATKEAIETTAEEALKASLKESTKVAAQESAKATMSRATAAFAIDALDVAINLSASTAVTVETTKSIKEVSGAEKDKVGSEGQLKMDEERLQDAMSAFAPHFALENAIMKMISQALEGESDLMLNKIL